ncbi:MAG: HAMP domain-containing protein, partial [Desulfamplus sp.]|nr:HAMP domain-containing protein [Desulfamplus sp.]
ALFASVVSFFISKKITRPIEEMTEGVQYFSEGDLDRKLLIPDSLEMSALALSMNSMASRLDEKIKTTIRQKNELDSVLSSMQEGVIALDQDNLIISINSSATQIFCVKPQMVQGRGLKESIRNYSLQKFIADAAQSNVPIERDIVLSTASSIPLIVVARSRSMLTKASRLCLSICFTLMAISI